MGLTLEQQKAVAIAQAKRKRLAQGSTAPGAEFAAYVKQHGLPGQGPLAFADQAIEAIPIAGPFIKEGLETARGGIGSLFGLQREDLDSFSEAAVKGSPVEATAGQVFGTVAPLAVAGMPAAGARVLGQAGGLASRTLFGGGSGYAIAGADALARGDTLEEAGEKAKLGAALGGALPVAERLAGVVFKALTGKALDPAETALARAIQDDGIPLDQLQRRIDELGPEAVLADLGPNLQRQAGALASLPGQAQKLVRSALMDRAAGTNRRIIADVDATLGPAPVPSKIAADIRAGQQALSPDYEAAFQGAQAVDTTDLALDLDSLAVRLRGPAQRAVKQVREMLNVTGVPDALDPDPYTLLQTRHAIDGLLDGEVNKTVIGALAEARRQVDSLLTEAVPGIKQVDAKFAELARQNEALGRGQQLLDSGRTAVRPAELSDEMATATDGVKLRLSQGARAEIERIIGTTANDLNALKTALKGDGSWNRERLALLFGPEKADRLLHILERERTFAATNDIVTRNSETAARTASQQEVNTGDIGQPRGITIPDLLLMAAQKTANVGARTRRSSTNAKIAEALMSRRLAPQTLGAVEQAIANRMKNSVLTPAAAPLLLQ